MTLKETINCAKVETLLHVSMVGKTGIQNSYRALNGRKITAYKNKVLTVTIISSRAGTYDYFDNRLI